VRTDYEVRTVFATAKPDLETTNKLIMLTKLTRSKIKIVWISNLWCLWSRDSCHWQSLVMSLMTKYADRGSYVTAQSLNSF